MMWTTYSTVSMHAPHTVGIWVHTLRTSSTICTPPVLIKTGTRASKQWCHWCCDYCNVLLTGKFPATLHDLQAAQTYATRVITGLGMHDHIDHACPVCAPLAACPLACQTQGAPHATWSPQQWWCTGLPPWHGDQACCEEDPVVWQHSTAHSATHQLQDTCRPVLFCGCSNLPEPSAWWYAMVPITFLIQKEAWSYTLHWMLWCGVVLDLWQPLDNGTTCYGLPLLAVPSITWCALTSIYFFQSNEAIVFIILSTILSLTFIDWI